MKSLFADTSYYLAIINADDIDRHRAMEIGSQWRGRVVLTDYILMELGNALSSFSRRRHLVPLIDLLKADRKVEIVQANEELFERGLELFGKRPDKEWSLTDCISFDVMTDYGLTEALTTDHHFEQAGFKALLK